MRLPLCLSASLLPLAAVGACVSSGYPAGGASQDHAASTPDAFEEPALDADAVNRLGWLAGCWERRGDTSLAEEQWMAPRGGTMLGMSRTVREGRAVQYESLRIEGRDDRIVYVASPSGQATAEFTATAVTDTLAAFENPAHDFPQRIIYRPGRSDSLWARVEGTIGGQARAADFRMARARCPGLSN